MLGMARGGQPEIPEDLFILTHFYLPSLRTLEIGFLSLGGMGIGKFRCRSRSFLSCVIFVNENFSVHLKKLILNNGIIILGP